MDTQVLLTALLIFVLRVLNMGLDTLRVVLTARDKKLATWITGFTVSVLFVVILQRVLTNLDEPINIIAYAGGYATGNVVGMYIENWLAMGHKNVRIISPRRGAAIAETLREKGFAVTEISARGRDGMVTILNIAVRRKQMSDVMALVSEVDEGAMITSEEVRPVHAGYWR
jgi:uncharacterized protein YebE (UPF0316 family)